MGRCTCSRHFANFGLRPLALPLRWLSANTASLHVARLRRVHDDAQSYANLRFRAMPACPLWVISRHLHRNKSCLLYPRKRTCAVQLGMSALGQKRTHAPHIAGYSITSSARASRLGGTVIPNALAVFILIAISNLVGACTGRSAGFSPLRMRSM